MSKHKTHKCNCEHENVEYCKTCKVCHCLDCSQEWSVKPTWYYSYPYQYGWTNQTLQSTLGGGSLLGGAVAGSISITNDGYPGTTTTALDVDVECEHTS